MIMKSKRLGDILVDSGLVSTQQLERILKLQKTENKKAGELFIQEGMVTEQQIIDVLGQQMGISSINLENYYIDPEIPRMINENLARRHVLLPVKKENGKLVVAMADPLNIFARDDVLIATGLEVEPMITTSKNILSAIDQYYGKQRAEKAAEEFKKQYDEDAIIGIGEAILDDVNSAPVVKLINTIVSQAVKMRASDIHIEPFEDVIRIRFRVDGELQEVMTPSKAAHSAIVTRIKIMGKMDIAEKRLPQDGRVETSFDGRDIDMRISSLPTVYGEKVVIRILDRSNFLAAKSELGFSENNLRLYDKIMLNPNGIIIVTGPTGSGKSTTLYSMLRGINKVNTNIITVEDPVEYKMNGINQVQVNVKAGLTFASGLRSILRQDPDIIMIGEIRDTETAEIAVRAAITGHLVLSTMHTNDAPSTVTRLVDMGIEPYLVSSALVGVVSQRLVRKICDYCKTEYHPDDREQKLLGVDEHTTIYRGSGCQYCNNTGYKGRTAIHEVLPISKDIRAMINQGASIDEIRMMAQKNGTTTLKDNCLSLVFAGVTTVDEMLRITYTID